MAELNSNVLNNVSETTSAPFESIPSYVDNKDRSVISELLLQLKPIERPLRNALNRRGLNGDKMSFENVVIMFYNEYVKDPKTPALPVTYLSEHPMSGVLVSNFDAVNDLDSIQVASSVVTGVKNLASNIRNKAKAKKAQKIADAGGYNTLTPFQKSLIQVPEYVNANLNKEQTTLGNEIDKEILKIEKKADGELSVTEAKLKKRIIVGIIIVFVLFAGYYFLLRK